jgi:DNA adenine methylase
MTPTKAKLRSPLKYHGGKSYLARRIIKLMPEHDVYVEPFCGGCSVLLNKPKAEGEIAGDAYGAVINFWRVLRQYGGTLMDRLSDVRYSEAAFLGAKSFLDHITPWTKPIGWALNFLVWNRMSRGGLGRDFAWSERLRGGQPGDLNAWQTMLEEMDAVRERVNDVIFEPCDARELIQHYGGEGALIYCDPPYLHETRTHKTAYAHEMSYEDHLELLAVLRRSRGKVMLSGYDSSLYSTVLRGWKCV